MDSKHKRIGFFAIAIATVGIGGVALAHGGGKGPGGFGKGGRGGERRADMIAEFDKNKDGKLDDAEKTAMHATMKARFEAMRAADLAKYDKNKDGKLDDAEHAVKREDHLKARFGEIDANHDGTISYDEFKAAKPGKDHERGPRGPRGQFKPGKLGKEKQQFGKASKAGPANLRVAKFARAK